MTKNILLAATALTVIGFSGVAVAGTLSGTVGSTTPRAVSESAAYVVASEKIDPTAAVPVTAAFKLENELTNEITVPAGATASYNVVFTVSGGSYVATPAVTAVDGAGAAVGTGATYIQADGSLISIITVDNSASATAKEIVGFTVVGSVKQVSEVSVAIGSTTSVVSGGSSIAIDNTAPVTIIEYKPFVKGFAAVSGTAEADLPSYTTFNGGDSTAIIATGYKVEANTGTIYGDFTGTALTLSNLVTSGTLTVIGTAGAQLDKLAPTVGPLTPTAATLTDTTAIFEVPAGAIGGLTTGNGLWLELDNDDEVVLNDASYQVAFRPVYAAAFTSPTAAFPAVASGTVTLEGTNFTAPWFTLTNPTNTATLRLANNGTANTGPVFVSLKANNGTNTAAQTRVKVSDGIAAGKFITVTGANLATLFGTNAGNADLQVTVQGDGKVISGKVRIQNIASGATFESTLGTLTN